MDITRWSIDYILCSQRWRSSIQSSKTRLGADCGSTHELLIAKFRLKLKEVGKTTRPFRYDLNQTNPLQLYSGSEKRIQGIRSDRQSAWRTTEVRLDDLRALPHLKVCSFDQLVWHAGLPWWLSGRGCACQCRRRVFDPWVRKIPWRRKWQPTPVLFPGKSHGKRSLEGYSPQGHKSVGHDWATKQHEWHAGNLLSCWKQFLCKIA